MIPDKNNFFDDFTEIFNLKSLLTEPLWFKFENQTAIGLILNNHKICWKMAYQIIIRLFSQF